MSKNKFIYKIKHKKNIRTYILLLIIIAIAILITILNVSQKADNRKSNKLVKHNYDWSCLSTKDGKKQYISKNGTRALVGIDVSTYQKNINWEKLKRQNIDFVFIRVGYRGYRTGKLNLDNKFLYNIKQANKVGIDVGVYFFSQAISKKEAKEEAKFVLDNIEDYSVKFPIVFDMEPMQDARINDLTTREKTDITLAFCKKIERHGYIPMIYGNNFWFKNSLYLKELAKYDLWLAEYSNQPSFPYEFEIWQYTSKGNISGISENVDLNLCFKNYPNI